MPRKTHKSISVPVTQWKAVKHLVNQYPQIAGRSVSEFYYVAAARRIRDLYEELRIKPEPVFPANQEQKQER